MNAVCPAEILRVQHNAVAPDSDFLAEETPVALVYNGISHVVLMATPQDLPALALGFSLSEGILENARQLYDFSEEISEDGILLHMEIPAARFARLKERRRFLGGRTGCGLCGLESLAAVKPAVRTVAHTGKIPLHDIQAALAAFAAHQPLRAQTGAVHGAAWAQNGKITALFEDIGRHNALDKLIGHLAAEHTDFSAGFALISSRAGYEMVVKTAAAGIGCLAAVSAPSAAAVRLADTANLTLVGFARDARQNIYTHPENLIFPPDAA